MDANSYDAYKKLVESNEVSKTQRQILLVLIQHGPQTAREIEKKLGSNNAHKRMAEIEKKGLITTFTSTTCSVTGQTAKVWKINPQRIPSNRIMKNNWIACPEYAQAFKKRRARPNEYRIYCAIAADGVLIKASLSESEVFEYCKQRKIEMRLMVPYLVWEFE